MDWWSTSSDVLFCNSRQQGSWEMWVWLWEMQSTKNTETEATNCHDHALVFFTVITESCHKQSDSDILVFRSKDAFKRPLPYKKNKLIASSLVQLTRYLLSRSGILPCTILRCSPFTSECASHMARRGGKRSWNVYLVSPYRKKVHPWWFWVESPHCDCNWVNVGACFMGII